MRRAVLALVLLAAACARPKTPAPSLRVYQVAAKLCVADEPWESCQMKLRPMPDELSAPIALANALCDGSEAWEPCLHKVHQQQRAAR